MKKSTATIDNINWIKCAHKGNIAPQYRDAVKLVSLGLQENTGYEIEDAAQILSWAFVIPAMVIMRDLEMMMES